jgi:hypothetical protein
MIQQILEKDGYFDWYIAQPDTQNPDSLIPSASSLTLLKKREPS